MPDVDDGSTSDDAAPGWDAITAALAALYPNQEPKHFGTIIGWRLGGPDPLDGISAWRRDLPVPHWHFVSYGLSDLYGKTNDDPDESGYGFELTFRLLCDPSEAEPPMWALNFIQNIARYVFQSGNVLSDGEWMAAGGPIAADHATQLRSLAFVTDPELPAIDTPHGRVRFIQIVGITSDEEAAAKRWQTRRLLEAFLPHMPLWVTDLDRTSLLDRADMRAAVEAGAARDGSSTGFLFMETLAWAPRKRLLRPAATTLTTTASAFRDLAEMLPLRLPFDRTFRLAGAGQVVVFRSGAVDALETDGDTMTVTMTRASVARFAAAARHLPSRLPIIERPLLEWSATN